MTSCPEQSPNRFPDDLRLYPKVDNSVGFLDSATSISSKKYCPVIHEPLIVVLPFLQVGLDSSDPGTNIESFIKSYLLERSVKTIWEKIEVISTEAESLLRKDFDIARNLEQAMNCLRSVLENFGVPHDIAVSYWRDPEARCFEALELVVKVDAKDFDSVLRLWELTDERIYETLNPVAKEKVIVIFERR
jgi:hypothetical protein